MFTMYHATTTSPAAFLNPPRSFLHSPPSRSALSLLHSQSAAAAATTTRAKMSSPSIQAPIALPADPEKPIVLGLGGIAVDFLATVNNFPKPDDKIRSTSLKVQGGGNAGNALTCAARLGLNARLISKVANDTQGRGILEELEADGVDTSFLVFRIR